MMRRRNPLSRRALLRVGVLGSAALVLPVAGGCSGGRGHLASLDEALRLLDFFAGTPELRSNGAWNPAQVFAHCAQSIEFSLAGFPEAKSALFQATVGAAAAGVFSALGQMRHNLAEPIPGAPALPAEADVHLALARLREAFLTFDRHRGTLHPHFAYGALAHADYLFAHVLHLDNHLDELHPLPPFLLPGKNA